MKLILINAPPYAGKDTAAKALRRYHNVITTVHIDRMSMPLKRAFAGVMGLPIDSYGIVEPWEHRKEDIVPELGISYRQFQIDLSENFMKPRCGNDVFGRLLWGRIAHLGRESSDLVIVPDCGFQIEADVLRRELDVNRILLVQIDRPGCEWDSREWVHVPGAFTIHLKNDKSVQEFEDLVVRVAEAWVTRR